MGYEIEIEVKDQIIEVDITDQTIEIEMSGATSWDAVADKPTVFPPEKHDHDEIYYRKDEINEKDRILTDGMSSVDGRVSKLEEPYLLKYVVPEDVSSIELTTDKNGNPFNFKEGEEIQIIINVKFWVNVTGALNSLFMRINGIGTAGIYKSATSESDHIILTTATRQSQYTTIRMRLVNQELHGENYNHFRTGATTFNVENSNFHTEAINIEAIQRFYFYRQSGQSLIPAGSIIMIRKL